MFLYNAFDWPWTRIAGLMAPRPLLFVNSDHDDIFPMDANERVINRLKRLYSLFGACDEVESVVSVGGHSYRKDIRQAAYRFINSHLKYDPRLVLDTEVDLVTESASGPQHPFRTRKTARFRDGLGHSERSAQHAHLTSILCRWRRWRRRQKEDLTPGSRGC